VAKLSSDLALKYRYFENQIDFFAGIIKDIEKAKKYIYLETYRYDDSYIARRIRDVLAKKAKDGVEIKILIDGWGALVDDGFFKKVTANGGEVRFFRKITFRRANWFSYNNRRDHRKLIVIDDKIIYTGSSNIAERVLNWRESNIRIEGPVAGIFKDIFLDNYEIHNIFYHDMRRHIFPLSFGTMEIIRDAPSLRHQTVKRRLIELMYSAKKSIILETPYFVPDVALLRAMKRATLRGVKVTLILPKETDSGLVDIVMASYFGVLHRKNIDLKFYSKKFNHSKVALIDNNFYMLGSTNLDFRSFLLMYELCIFGRDKRLIEIVRNHINETLKDTKDFNYEDWKNRKISQKFMEFIVKPFRAFF
jgi:cardiolipin synthase A/B